MKKCLECGKELTETRQTKFCCREHSLAYQYRLRDKKRNEAIKSNIELNRDRNPIKFIESFEDFDFIPAKEFDFRTNAYLRYMHFTYIGRDLRHMNVTSTRSDGVVRKIDMVVMSLSEVVELIEIIHTNWREHSHLGSLRSRDKLNKLYLQLVRGLNYKIGEEND